MKQLLFLLFFTSFVGYGQVFAPVDNIVNSYPRYTSPEQLASKIAKDFKDDASKARAAFKWLTNNIRYDLEEYYQPKRTISFRYTTEEERLSKLQAIKDKIVKDAFLTKMGVCEEYAQSFKKVADLLGLESEVIKGYVRNSAQEIGKPPRRTNHAWNSVKINNRWILLDATWAAGYLYNGAWRKNFNEYYFAVDPKKIGRTHYPDDRKWQIVLNQNSLTDFYNQPIYAQDFLRSNMEVISPSSGNISISKTEDVVLKIKNLTPSSRLYYNYRGQRYSEKPKIVYNNNIATVTIENPGSDTELYLFLDRNIALEYNVFVE
ncbi:MAG: transglutaminase [Flavobacteriaceae bacterium]